MNPQQPSLFPETYEEAIRATCDALGGFKKVGNLLWPAMPADDAGRKLAACLNPEKREKLDLGELRLIRVEARRAGVHILAFWEMRDAGYSDPQPITPKDEAAELQRRFIASVDQLRELQAQLLRNGMQVVG